jgi:flagellar P-ring protein precursor FlgI
MVRMTLMAAAFGLVCAASAAQNVPGVATGAPGGPARPGEGVPVPVSVSASPPAISIQDLVRIKGQGRSVLRGVGIVVGLRGTGDSGKESALARPLQEVYRNSQIPLSDVKELERAKAAALVWIDCEIPEGGARVDDQLDVHVSVMHSASSIEGGRLIIAPLLGPLPGQPEFAMASGPVTIEDKERPTVGRIRLGASVVRDVLMPEIDGSLTLIVRPHFRGWTTTRTIANGINGSVGGSLEGTTEDGAGSDSAVARADDDMQVTVKIPEAERADPANFIARVLGTRISPTLLDLPAQVVVNERTGAMVITGDVEISPVAIAYKDLVVSTTTPAPVPTATDPLVTRESLIPVATSGRAAERARLADLIAAFKQLDVPVKDQIHIISEIHKTGRLHATLVVE